MLWDAKTASESAELALRTVAQTEELPYSHPG